MSHHRFLPCGLAALALAAWPAGLASQPAGLDALYRAYAGGDYQVLYRSITTEAHFEAVRKELGFEKDGFFYDGLERWSRDRQLRYSSFMLDFALVGFNRGWRFWQYVADERPDDAAYGSEPRTVQGVSHCDRNLFAGDAPALYRYWNGSGGSAPRRAPRPGSDKIAQRISP